MKGHSNGGRTALPEEDKAIQIQVYIKPSIIEALGGAKAVKFAVEKIAFGYCNAGQSFPPVAVEKPLIQDEQRAKAVSLCLPRKFLIGLFSGKRLATCKGSARDWMRNTIYQLYNNLAK